MDGGKGNDISNGNGDTDSFVFAADFGDDTIVDFENGVELVDISSAGFSSSDLNVTTSGSDAVVDFGGSDTITFSGLAGSIDASDFVF